MRKTSRVGPIELVYEDRTGLRPGFDGIAAPVIEDVKMSIPAMEALEREGHVVTLSRAAAKTDPYYTVELCGKRMPRRLDVSIRLIECEQGGYYERVVLRTEEEPEWPGIVPDEMNMWLLAEWLPCPVCAAPIVWYEAGFVPGYRICTRPPYHHSLIAN